MTTATGLRAGLPEADPASLGFSAERLARIDQAIARRIERREIPGAVTLVARRGRVAHLSAQGYADIEQQTPLRPDAIFRIASMTKPIAALATLMLYEEGHFFLDDPIARFLPGFKDMRVLAGAAPPGVHVPFSGAATVPAVRPITVRDCLTHTAGFAANPATPGGNGAVRTIADQVEELATKPLVFQPGTGWLYGPGLNVAGVIVETISGQTLDAFMRERIFDPLGMPDSSFYLPEGKLDRFPPLYQSEPAAQPGGWQLREIDRPETSTKVHGPKIQFGGSGGLLSTAADYARFAQLLLNGGELDGVRLLGRKTVELMTTNHTGDHYIYVRGRGYGYGLGVGVRLDLTGNPAVGTPGAYGWGGAYSTYYFADPAEQLLGLIFLQVNPAVAPTDVQAEATGQPEHMRRAGQEFERIVYQALVD
ncbi:MAG TPA: serine hydrolase domain-containing protein [Dehalococcoidia bacterium]|nr:serine hydrolase domain-containing protein [Dehalococcoidia bacterium]